MNSDDGGRISVDVTASKDGYKSWVATLSREVHKEIVVPPTVFGFFRFLGEVYPYGWESGAALTYQWNRDGVPIPGATKERYKLVAADVGKLMTVSVTGKMAGYPSATVISNSFSF